ATEAGDWTTFAADDSRQHVVPAGPRLLDRISQLCRPGPTWRFDLQKRTRQKETVTVMPETRTRQVDAARRLAFYPVVVGDVALAADAHHITASDLRTGKPRT